MSVQILANASVTSDAGGLSCQIDYDDVSQTIGITAVAGGQGHATLTIDMPIAGKPDFVFGPRSLDSLVNRGRVPLPDGNPQIIPPAGIPQPTQVGPHTLYPYSITLGWVQQ